MQFNEARKRISSAVSRKANVQKRFSRGFSMAKIQATKDKCTDNPVLLGDISKPIPPTAKIVRIFTSSTFTGLYALTNQPMSFLGGCRNILFEKKSFFVNESMCIFFCLNV